MVRKAHGFNPNTPCNFVNDNVIAFVDDVVDKMVNKKTPTEAETAWYFALYFHTADQIKKAGTTVEEMEEKFNAWFEDRSEENAAWALDLMFRIQDAS